MVPSPSPKSDPAREPVVLSPDRVALELTRLGGQLRDARVAGGVTTRDTAAAAGLNLGTLWRIEQGRSRPTLLRFGRLAVAVGLRLELAETVPRVREEAARGGVAAPAGYRARPLGRGAVATNESAKLDLRVHAVRVRMGAELWWARQHELHPPLDAAGVCRLLGMSPHTLVAVEFGPAWPDLASVVRVAGVTGRQVQLVDADLPPTVPLWEGRPG